jgi:hypothetical protein
VRSVSGFWDGTHFRVLMLLLQRRLLLHAPNTACPQQLLLRLLPVQALLAAASWQGVPLLMPLLLLLLLGLLQHEGRQAWLPASGPGSNCRAACGPTSTMGPLPLLPGAC